MKRLNHGLAILGLLLSIGAGAVRACDKAAPACSCKPCCCDTKCQCDPCKCENCAACTERPSLLGSLIGIFVGEVFAESLAAGGQPEADAVRGECLPCPPSPRSVHRPPQYMVPNSPCASSGSACPAVRMPEPMPLPPPPMGCPSGYCRAAVPPSLGSAGFAPSVVRQPNYPMPMWGIGMPATAPAPWPGAKRYTVQLRLREGTAPNEKDCAHIAIYEGQSAEVTYSPDGDRRKSAKKKVRVAVRSGAAGQAFVSLATLKQLSGARSGVRAIFSSKHAVKLDEPTKVKLPDVGEDICCAEVTVHAEPSETGFASMGYSGPACGPNGCFMAPGTPNAIEVGAGPLVCGPNGCPMAPGMAYMPPPPNFAPSMPYYPGMPYDPPMSPPPNAMPMHVAIPCVTPAPVPAEPNGPSQFRIVKENGKSRLEMRNGSCATCVRLALQTRNADTLRLCAGKKQVHVSGRLWKATADQVETSPDGTLVLLTGHVKLVSDKVGACAKVLAECVCVQMRDGRVEMVLDNTDR